MTFTCENFLSALINEMFASIDLLYTEWFPSRGNFINISIKYKLRILPITGEAGPLTSNMVFNISAASAAAHEETIVLSLCFSVILKSLVKGG